MTNSLLAQPDFARFQAKDPEWFLDAVAETIVGQCGWHIAPSVVELDVESRVGNKGIVMLPSLFVTSVEALRLNGSVVDPALYTMHRAGFIEFSGFRKPPRNCTVSVDFTHGYATTPKAVAEVGFELAATALEKASGVVTDMTRGPTRLTFKEFGVVLSEDQKNRLGPFTLVRVGS